MKLIRVRVILIVMAVVMAVCSAYGVPASHKPYVVTQPDGTTLTLHKVGDERLHFTLTDDNKLVACDDNGQYSYARVDAANNIVSTGIRALDSRVRPAEHAVFTVSINDVDVPALIKRREATGTLRSLNARNIARLKARAAAQADGNIPPQNGLGLFPGANYPVTGKVNALIIVVEYSDVKLDTSVYNGTPMEYINDMFKKEGFNDLGSTGSVTDYFRDMSGGRFNPNFDIVGPVTLPYNRAYYGGNDSNGDDIRPELMVVHAVQMLDSEVDFSKYDNNGDGVIDNIYVIYAGKGEADGGEAETVWPHARDIALLNLVVDGVLVSSYACGSELQGNGDADGIGTFVHEYSHVLGLPDLYAIDYNGSLTPGFYSALDMGCYNNSGRTPPGYGAFERNALGWSIPRLLDGPEDVTLSNIQDSDDFCLIQTPYEKEFFLLENRQKKGWDAYLPGHGLLIWRIEYDDNIYLYNCVNNTPSHQYVDIMEANGNRNSPAGWTWPGTANKTAFTATTSPAMRTWRGDAVDMPVTEIAEDANGVITFKVAGGTRFPQPVLNPTANVVEDGFTISWEPVEGANDYFVSVYKHTGCSSIRDVEAPFGSISTNRQLILPDGWTSTSTDTYIGSGMYGAEIPSLKMSETGQTLTTQLFDASIGKLSFWCRGNSGIKAGSSLAVEGLIPADATATATNASDVSGEWVALMPAIDLYANNKTARTYEVDDIPANVRAVRFVMTKGVNSANCALDDVRLTGYGEQVSVVPAYDNLSTGGLTTLAVTGLDKDATYYHYTVSATDGEAVSRPTDPVKVTLGAGAVDDIAADAVADVITATGRTLTVNTAAVRVAVYDTTGRFVADRSVSDGMATLTLPDAGLYIVRAAGAHKVVVR